MIIYVYIYTQTGTNRLAKRKELIRGIRDAVAARLCFLALRILDCEGPADASLLDHMNIPLITYVFLLKKCTTHIWLYMYMQSYIKSKHTWKIISPRQLSGSIVVLSIFSKSWWFSGWVGYNQVGNVETQFLHLHLGKFQNRSFCGYFARCSLQKAVANRNRGCSAGELGPPSTNIPQHPPPSTAIHHHHQAGSTSSNMSHANDFAAQDEPTNHLDLDAVSENPDRWWLVMEVREWLGWSMVYTQFVASIIV